MPTRSIRRAALACPLVALLASAPASAAPQWLPPVDLSATGRNADDVKISVDPGGDAVALWAQYPRDRVQSAVRPAGEAWQAATDVSSGDGAATAPQLAVGANGDAIAMWILLPPFATGRIQAASRAWNAPWRPPEDVTQSQPYSGDPTTPFANSSDFNPRVAIDRAGNAVGFYQARCGFHGGVPMVIALRRPVGGAWASEGAISPCFQNALDPRLAMGFNGDAVAIWQVEVQSSVLRSATHVPGGGWASQPDPLAAVYGSVSTPRIAVDGSGNAAAVWSDGDASATRVMSATLPAGGTWSAPVALTGPLPVAPGPQIAVDPAGNAVAVWRRLDGTRNVVQAATRAAGGTWQQPVDISAADADAVLPQVAMDPRGATVVVWLRADGDHDVVQSAARPPGGAWQPPVDVSGAGYDAFEPRVALDAEGNATAVWRGQRQDGSAIVAQSAGYDAAGPRLRALSIPASGVAGSPVSLSVDPLDVWSPLAATTWSFGDGASATGAAVTHTFAGLGSYEVRVSSSDSLSNVTSATGTIRVAATPAPPARRRRVPALSELRLWPGAFRAARSGPAVRFTTARTATRVRYALDGPAAVRFTVQRSEAGRRSGRQCVAPAPRNRGGRACERLVGVPGGFTRVRPAGADRLTFRGRVAGRTLAAGVYRLTATPIARGVTGVARHARFRIATAR
jgi:hypothetical protein